MCMPEDFWGSMAPAMCAGLGALASVQGAHGWRMHCECREHITCVEHTLLHPFYHVSTPPHIACVPASQPSPTARAPHAHGVDAQGAAACQPVKLFVYVKDAQHRQMKEGGEEVVVRVQPSSRSMGDTMMAEVEDNKNGIYTATYTAPAKGNYMVSVEVNGLPISGSPFPVFFSAPVDPAVLAQQEEEERRAAAAAAAPPPPGVRLRRRAVQVHMRYFYACARACVCAHACVQGRHVGAGWCGAVMYGQGRVCLRLRHALTPTDTPQQGGVCVLCERVRSASSPLPPPARLTRESMRAAEGVHVQHSCMCVCCHACCAAGGCADGGVACCSGGQVRRSTRTVAYGLGAWAAHSSATRVLSHTRTSLL